MKTLYLLRHAKSNWGNPDISDFERTLNERGVEGALWIGQCMQTIGIEPDLIISSPAKRTRETLEHLQTGAGEKYQIDFPKALYLASTETILNIIKNTTSHTERLMIVGHNPGLHELALSLIKSGVPEDMEKLNAKYPTGTLLEILFSIDCWMDAGPNEGCLQRYIKPRLL